MGSIYFVPSRNLNELSIEIVYVFKKRGLVKLVKENLSNFSREHEQIKVFKENLFAVDTSK